MSIPAKCGWKWMLDEKGFRVEDREGIVRGIFPRKEDAELFAMAPDLKVAAEIGLGLSFALKKDDCATAILERLGRMG